MIPNGLFGMRPPMPVDPRIDPRIAGGGQPLPPPVLGSKPPGPIAPIATPQPVIPSPAQPIDPRIQPVATPEPVINRPVLGSFDHIKGPTEILEDGVYKLRKGEIISPPKKEKKEGTPMSEAYGVINGKH